MLLFSKPSISVLLVAPDKLAGNHMKKVDQQQVFVLWFDPLLLISGIQLTIFSSSCYTPVFLLWILQLGIGLTIYQLTVVL